MRTLTMMTILMTMACGDTADKSNPDTGTEADADASDGRADEGDADGFDADSPDAGGTDADGSDVDGSDADGSDADGSDADGSGADGSDTGSDADGSDADGSDTGSTADADADGSDTGSTADADADGSDTGSTADADADAGPTDPATIDYCHIQWPCEMTAIADESTETVYTWVYAAGITEGVGAGAGVEVQLGIGPDDSWPDDDWSWVDAVFNDDKEGLTPGVLSNDEFAAAGLAPSTPGHHDYAARARLTGGAWILCDLGDECDGGSGSTDGYDPSTSGHLVVELPVYSSITVTSPGGGDLWIDATTVDITWTSEGDIELVDITLIDDAGIETEIATDIANSGSHSWAIPFSVALGRNQMICINDSADTVGGCAGDFTLGALIGFQWNGSEEEILRLSPVMDDSSLMGTVGDLMWWSSQVVVDHAGEVIYVMGSTEDSISKLYTLNMWTGDLVDELVFSPGGSGWEINSEGKLIGCRWSGSEEELFTVDPLTGGVEVIGIVGDLASWSGQTVIDNSIDRMYIIGTNSSGTTQLWVMDSVTGDLIETITPTDFMGGSGLQMSPSGNAVYAYWNGSEEILTELNLTTGERTDLGTVGDLGSWSGQTVVDPTNNTILIWGNGADGTNIYAMDVLTGELLYTTPVERSMAAPRFIY